LHENDFAVEHIELQLAHQKRDKVAAAYNHAEVFGRYFALECLCAYSVTGFQYASQGFVAILEALREIPRK
jgi:hypothetical protein